MPPTTHDIEAGTSFSRLLTPDCRDDGHEEGYAFFQVQYPNSNDLGTWLGEIAPSRHGGPSTEPHTGIFPLLSAHGIALDQDKSLDAWHQVQYNARRWDDGLSGMVVAPEPLGPFNSGVPLLPGAGAPFAIGFDYLDDFTGIGQSNFLNTTPQQIAHNHFTPNVTEPYLDFGVDPEPQQNQDFYQQALNGSELDFVTGAWMPNHSAYQPMWPTAPQLDMTLDAGLHQAVAPAPPAPAPSNIPLPTRAVGHACLNCQKTFKRAGDYRRHMRSYAAPQFHCFVQGCTKAFTRKDKRRDHMRQGHKLAV